MSRALRAACGEFPRSRRGCARAREFYQAECCSRPNRRGELSTQGACDAQLLTKQTRNGGQGEPFGRPMCRGHNAKRIDWASCLRGWRVSFGNKQRRRFWNRVAWIGSSADRGKCRRGRSSRLRRCLAVTTAIAVIRRRDKRNWLRPRIRCRRGRAERSFCSGPDRQSASANPRGD